MQHGTQQKHSGATHRWPSGEKTVIALSYRDDMGCSWLAAHYLDCRWLAAHHLVALRNSVLLTGMAIRNETRCRRRRECK